MYDDAILQDLLHSYTDVAIYISPQCLYNSENVCIQYIDS